MENSFLEPEKIIAQFGLKSGDHIADFGAGHGYFTIPMARAVGGDGKIYAIDIQKSVLDIIRAKARAEHLLTIEYLWSDLDQPHGSKLKDLTVNFVLIANILFQTEHAQELLAEARRILCRGGQLALVEWSSDENTSLGPPHELRISQTDARQRAEKTGFTFEKEIDAGSHHYGLLFSKK